MRGYEQFISRMIDGECYVNVAYAKSAKQSSLSIWSTVNDDSSRVLSGPMPDSYAFHTDREPNPWLVIDLGTAYNINQIEIFNRRDGFNERCKTLIVEGSIYEHKDWVALYDQEDQNISSESWSKGSLTVKSDVYIRYIKISLREENYLHLAKVLVFTSLISFLETVTNAGKLNTGYEIVSENTKIAPDCALLIGEARFGNMIIKYANAIGFAERANLKRVMLPTTNLLQATDVICYKSLSIESISEKSPKINSFISGSFFDYDTSPLDPLIPLIDKPDEELLCRICRDVIRPSFLRNVQLAKVTSDRLLTIHIRSGDIFTEASDVSGYRQPPLSFYKVVLSNLLEADRIDSVLLVFEDRGNPCIEALEDLLADNQIYFETQSDCLAKDLSSLIDAKHLVFGFGTFGYAACRLSNEISTLHYFSPEIGGSYAEMPVIKEVFRVTDKAGNYFRAFHDDWTNNLRDRQMMLDYPVSCLAIDKVRT